MATTITKQGLQFAVGRLSATADGFAALQSVSVDDSATALGTATTNLGSPTNLAVRDFDATPTRSNETVTHEVTFPTTEANFNIERIVIHNAPAASVNGTSNTVFGGVDGQNLQKTADFQVKFILRNTATDQS